MSKDISCIQSQTSILGADDGRLGFLNVLRVLTTVGDVSYEAFNERFDFMAARNDTYYVLVICDEKEEVVGTGAVVVERKFIHGLGELGLRFADTKRVFLLPWLICY